MTGPQPLHAHTVLQRAAYELDMHGEHKLAGELSEVRRAVNQLAAAVAVESMVCSQVERDAARRNKYDALRALRGGEAA